MLAGVTAEALKRIASARSLLRVVESHERGVGRGDDASRAAKGMILVHNYAVYEYVVVETVKALVRNVNSRGLPFASTRAELLGLALDPEFTSVISGALKKTWAGRAALLQKVRSTTVVSIVECLFPKDGTQFRPAQLETIWSLFGLPGTILPEPRLRGHIEEMVEARNRIAHGNEAPDTVGGRFTIGDLEKRISDTEAVCTHIMTSASSYAANSNEFQ